MTSRFGFVLKNGLPVGFCCTTGMTALLVLLFSLSMCFCITFYTVTYCISRDERFWRNYHVKLAEKELPFNEHGRMKQRVDVK